MATITSNSRYIEIDGRTAIALSDNAVVNLIATGVRIKFMSGSYTDIGYEGTTVDGAATATAQELYDWFKSKGFNSGGGDGDGVTWDQVTDKPLYTLGTPIQDAEGLVPVYTQNGQLPVGMPEFPENAVPLILLDVRAPELEQGNFLVGGEDGNEQRRVVGADLGVTQTSNNWYVARWNPTNQEWGGTVQLVSPTANALVIRTSAGQGRFSPAINEDEAVVLSQFSGIVDDTLTDSETSASLNAVYSSAVIGIVVTTQTGLSEYRKIASEVWSKKTIEIV